MKMKSQEFASEQSLFLKIAKISQKVNLLTEEVGRFINSQKKHKKDYMAKTKFKAVRDLENKQYLNQSCLESLPVEEKLRVGYYNF